MPGSSNSPYHGGTHLPDMTVVTPAFIAAGPRAGFLRRLAAHHPADIGGATPGSMPPFNRAIDRGRHPLRMLRAGEGGTAQTRPRCAATWSPARGRRRPDQNLADLRAQLAANARGIAEIRPRRATATACGRSKCTCAGGAGQRRAQHAQRHRTASRPAASATSWTMATRSRLSHPRSIHSARPVCRRFHRHLRTGRPQHSAPRAVCMAAVLYVFRTLIDAPHSLNEGCLEPIEIIIPDGSRCSTHGRRRRWRPAAWRPPSASSMRTSMAFRGAGRVPGHDEQPHLRRCTPAVLTRPSPAAPAPAPRSPAATRCRRTQWTNSRLTGSGDPGGGAGRCWCVSSQSAAGSRRSRPWPGRRRHRAAGWSSAHPSPVRCWPTTAASPRWVWAGGPQCQRGGAHPPRGRCARGAGRHRRLRG